MLVIIQHIHSIWTKQSRGGEWARKRNSVPKSVLIPSNLKNAPFMLHHAKFAEESNFLQKDILKSSNEFHGLGIRDLEISTNEDQLKIRLLRDGYNAAKFSSYPFAEAFELLPGEWGQLTYNGRYTAWDGNWWYEQSTFNVAWVENLKPRLFISNNPTHCYAEMARLR